MPTEGRDGDDDGGRGREDPARGWRRHACDAVHEAVGEQMDGQHWEHVVMHDLKRLRVVALDLSTPPKRILWQIERIAGSILLQAQPEAA